MQRAMCVCVGEPADEGELVLLVEILIRNFM